MQIGNLNVNSRAFLAPMAEVTDFVFRKIAKDYGAGLTYTQMVSAEGVIKNNFETLRLFTFSRSEKPIGVQLLGNEPEILGKAVKEIVKYKPDVIDLNSGCPVDKVYSSKMGSYLLSQPEHLGKIVKQMVRNSEGVPISVKIRLGPKDKVNVLDNAKVIEDNGASVITVHARTRNDRYAAVPDWEWIAKVKEAVSIPVVGNGSVFSAEDAVKMIESTKCDAILVGRGALGNPFVFKQIESLLKGIKYNPDITEIYNVAYQHIELLEKEQGFTKSLDKAKKNVIWYFKDQNGIWELIDQLYAQNTFTGIKEVLKMHIDKLHENFYPQIDVEDINRKFNNKVLFWLAKEEEKI
ncbi:MAG: tRNA dihydrouridine synthase DusB [Ignavibacteriales bacterium]|nr:tRNA dihydrouridine synthase DusB [Ignavibacteriales bacterium]